MNIHMNTIELKAYILNKVEDAKDVEMTMNEDGSFYVRVECNSSSCGALFSSTGRMRSMACISFDSFEDELTDKVEDATTQFFILKKRQMKGN